LQIYAIYLIYASKNHENICINAIFNLYSRKREGYILSPPFDLLVPLFSVLAPTESVELFKLVDLKPLAAVEPSKVPPPAAPVAVSVAAARPRI
jgi:hypothetical protein